MMKFDPKYFREFNFSQNQIKKYMEAACKDLNIAKRDDFCLLNPNVK